MSQNIVCMVRGGEAGRSTQEAAIVYAKQTGKQLVFMHVINPERLALENEELSKPALTELTWLGRLNLSMARQRAEAEGVRSVQIIRTGPILDSVTRYLTENQVDKLFLGLPREGLEDYDQRLEQVKNFAAKITDACGVPIELIRTDC